MARSRISPALVVACIALAVALGGVSYAAVTLPKNSVGAKQLKKNAVNGKKVQDKSLSAADIKQSSLAFSQSIMLRGWDFEPTDSGTTAGGLAAGGRFRASGGGYLAAQVELPQGAKLKTVVLYLVDNHATNISYQLTRLEPATGAGVILENFATSVMSAGVIGFGLTVDPVQTIDNTKYSYRLEVAPGVNGPAHTIMGAKFVYTLS